MKAGWRDAPLALRDSVVSNMQVKQFTGINFSYKEICLICSTTVSCVCLCFLPHFVKVFACVLYSKRINSRYFGYVFSTNNYL